MELARIDFESVTLRSTVNANQVVERSKFFKTPFWNAQHALAIAQQVDFHQVTLPLEDLLLLRQIRLASRAGTLVRWTEHFDQRDEFHAVVGVEDFNAFLMDLQFLDRCGHIIQWDQAAAFEATAARFFGA